MVSRQAAFVVVVAQRANGILDRMFSERLLSSDSIAESLCLVVGSNCIALMLMVLPADRIGENFPVLGLLVLITFVCAAAPLVSPRLRMLRRAFMWMFAAFYLLVLFSTLRDWNLPREMILLVIVQSLLGIFFATVLWGLVLSIAGIMLLHRIICPLTSRLLYAVGRHRLVQNKLALHAAAAALTGIATGTHGLQSILNALGFA
jgi:hypothetical protein